MEIKVNKVLGKYEDVVAIYFKLDYDDVELYSVTVEDAYRTPTVEIMNKEQLNKFIREFQYGKNSI